MSLLSKAVKGIGKIAKKNKKALLTGVRVIAAGLTKGKSEQVIQKVQGIGAAVKTYKGLTKKPTKGEAAVMAKIQKLAPPKIVGISSVKATTMPGGAKLKGVPETGGSTVRRKVAAAKPKKAKKAAKPKAVKAPGLKKSSGRKPPSGGLDLKALSASWAKAGKPGTWQQWIAQNK